jgi:hypothetical protein
MFVCFLELFLHTNDEGGKKFYKDSNKGGEKLPQPRKEHKTEWVIYSETIGIYNLYIQCHRPKTFLYRYTN